MLHKKHYTVHQGLSKMLCCNGPVSQGELYVGAILPQKFAAARRRKPKKVCCL
jgi:hypothetical protein